MVTEDQSAAVACLGSASTYGVGRVERMETHASIVFLAGDRAYKLKRAVRFDYLDFSTADRRRAMCEAEVRLNRRTAPALYRRVVAITRQPDGSCALGGDGLPVDWVVEMTRFPQEALLDRLATSGGLALELMPQLGEAVASFHRSAEPRPDHGGVRGMRWVVDGNAAGFAEFGRACLDESAARRLTDDLLGEVERRGSLLERRRETGLVRQCHGDLHLRNIVLLDGRPTLFDAIEFNDEIACTDVLYDLAFLLMDLGRRRLPRHASAVWNRYLAHTGDLDGVPLMPLFLSCRAAVRAKTSATAAAMQADATSRRPLEETAREYLALAGELLHPPPPVLVAIGGLSGSGKSTLARRLAPGLGAVPGGIVLRSDEIRKQLCGVPPTERLGAAGYAPPVTDRVYQTLADRAAKVVAGGHSAITDAVYASSAERLAIERVAAAASVPFVGLWLDAPEPVLIARVGERRGDASDADAGVVRRQGVLDTGPMTWRRIDATGSPDAVYARVVPLVEEHRPDARKIPAPA